MAAKERGRANETENCLRQAKTKMKPAAEQTQLR
jgi:hypothetical protein